MKPLCIDLFCGLGGWTEGFLAEGYDVIGFDIEQRPYPSQLVLQDVLTLHGSQFRNAAVIVASPPCQAYSYRAMPWKRAKELPPPDNTLFEACFRIQREACEAAGRYIPLVIENVCGAQKWVGRAAWHFGSFYLWGDVPALMPVSGNGRLKFPAKCGPRLWKDRDTPRLNDGESLLKQDWWSGTKSVDGEWFGAHGGTNIQRDANGYGLKQGGNWWHDPESLTRRFSSRSEARKAASAQIAKIPFPLAQHIARVYKPDS